MFTNNKIAKSISLAIAFGAVTGLNFSTAALAQDADDAADNGKIEKIQVTGSRIRRADMEGALPITVIDRTAIEFSGQTSVADLLRNTNFNSAGSARPQSGSSAQGVSSVNLRGLGADRTLILIDGRRLPKSPSTGATQDLNSIPTAIIERIEILTDGASAAYGSDAIGGVINIITRKDYDGVELKIGAGQIEHEGGDREEGSIIFGTSSDKGSLVGGVSWNHRDIVFARDFPWYSPGASVYGNSFTTTNEAGTDQLDWTALPGGCNDGEGFFLLDNANAVANSAGVKERCAYNFALESADEASTGVLGFFLNSRYEINDDWSIFSNMSWNKTESFGRYAPVPDSSSPFAGGSGVPLSADSPNNPTNPDSAMYDAAFGDPSEVYIWHRFDALGNRDNTTENELQDLLVGAEGEIGDYFVDFGVRRTKSKTYDIGRNYLVRTTAEAYIQDGTYDLQNPSANDAEVLNAMKATISRISFFNQDEVFGSIQGDLFDMDGGAVTGLVGFEWREETYSDQYDSLSEAGAIGGSAGNSAGGGRMARAAYFEALMPVSEELEVTVAGRYDDYSDYGSDFSPKISAKYTPIEDLVVRASYGKGFRAPTLDILTQKDSFSADSVRDPQSCLNQGEAADCETQINGLRTANPDLSSEQSTQIALGVAYQPLEMLSFSVDYFDIEIEERINFFDAQELIDREKAGDPIPAGLGVERVANGSISRIVQGYGNDGTLNTSGIDFDVTYSDSFDMVDIRSSLRYSHVLDYKTDGGRDQIGDDGLPESRATLATVFTVADFDLAWNMNYIGSTAEEVDDGQQLGHIPSWITHDLNVTCNTPINSRITLGANNVFGKEPPLYPAGGRDYNFDLYDGYGRYLYVRYTQSF
jgi:iron complex outermembrane receptor protein